MIRHALCALSWVVGLSVVPAHAHFPWLATEEGRPILFFSENPAERNYRIPDLGRPEVHYATCTFDVPQGVQADVCLPTLPEGVASFGGAACGGFVYLYGGHIGEEHAHSRDNLARAFRRAKIAEQGTGAWDDLPMQTPLQGLALATYRNKLYRVGGLSILNAPGRPI